MRDHELFQSHPVSDLKTIEGTILSLVYFNESNSYTVARIECDRTEEQIIVVGSMVPFMKGEKGRFKGRFEEHSKHG